MPADGGQWAFRRTINTESRNPAMIRLMGEDNGITGGSVSVGVAEGVMVEAGVPVRVGGMVCDGVGDTVAVEVEEPGVRAVIYADPEEGTAPLTVEFDGSESSTFTGNIVSYEWDFGDGSPPTITGATVSHKYNEVGTYTVSLKVVTNENESAEIEKQIFVREIPLRACFTPSRRSGTAPLTVTFDSKCSTGAVSKYSWDFGDGETSESRKPTHTFEYSGTFNVTLEVTDDKNNVNSFSDVIVAEGEVE